MPVCKSRESKDVVKLIYAVQDRHLFQFVFLERAQLGDKTLNIALQ